MQWNITFKMYDQKVTKLEVKHNWKCLSKWRMV